MPLLPPVTSAALSMMPPSRLGGAGRGDQGAELGVLELGPGPVPPRGGFLPVVEALGGRLGQVPRRHQRRAVRGERVAEAALRSVRRAGPGLSPDRRGPLSP